MMTNYEDVAKETPLQYSSRADFSKRSDGTWDIGLPCPGRKCYDWFKTGKKTRKAAERMLLVAAETILIRGALHLEDEAKRQQLLAFSIRGLAGKLAHANQIQQLEARKR